jgi:death on curing protein
VKEPAWLDSTFILDTHDRLIARYGGLAGVRDAGLVESALQRPRNKLAFGQPSLFELAAAYGFGIARNHPFLDGNKRTALAAIDLFLQANGYELQAPNPNVVRVIEDLAAGIVDESMLTAWIEQHAKPL